MKVETEMQEMRGWLVGQMAEQKAVKSLIIKQ